MYQVVRDENLHVPSSRGSTDPHLGAQSTGRFQPRPRSKKSFAALAGALLVACGGTGPDLEETGRDGFSPWIPPSGEAATGGAASEFWGTGGQVAAGGAPGGACGFVQFLCNPMTEDRYWTFLENCMGPYEVYESRCDGTTRLVSRAGWGDIEIGSGGAWGAGGQPAQGAGGHPVGAGGEYSPGAGGAPAGGSAGGGASGDILPGANRCGFAYSSCVEIALGSCASEAASGSCTDQVNACKDEHHKCVADIPSCENQVSSCFATAEACLEKLPDSTICNNHYDFCLELATECRSR